jgi:hypothetical protein
MSTRCDPLPVGTLVLLLCAMTTGCGKPEQSDHRSQTDVERLSDGHPDLSGFWRPEGGRDPNQPYPGMEVTEVPPYRDEYLRIVNENKQRLGYADPTWKCEPPGIPRVGAPYMIIQRPGQIVFIYADYGTVYVGNEPRVIYTDGRPPLEGNDPSFYGDSVGHWEGDTLVVESRNFVPSTWIGARGEIHSDQMRVVERFTRSKDRLRYEATIHDPVMLTGPWSKKSFDLVPSDVPLFESPPCVQQTDEAHAVLEQQAIDAQSGKSDERKK